MFEQARHPVLMIAASAAILLCGFADNASAATSVNGTELNGRYLNGVQSNGRYLNGVSGNGIRLTNGVSLNGMRLGNGASLNGIRLRNGSAVSGRPTDRTEDTAATPALRPSRLCSIEPEFCGAQAPRAEPSNVNVLFVTLPNGESQVLK